MRITKTCSICGYQFTYDDKVFVSPFVEPHDDGARYYYNLWHYFVEKCPHCGYASKDISKVVNKDIIKDSWYEAVSDMPIINTLNKARPNRVADYLHAGIYYESIGNQLNYAKCMLQACDLVYNEMMYWDEYVLDSSNSLSAIQNKAQYNEFKKFADGLFVKGLSALEEYVTNNAQDIDAIILLAGTLNTGDNFQKIKGARYLSTLRKMPVTIAQRQAIEFLENRMN